MLPDLEIRPMSDRSLQYFRVNQRSMEEGGVPLMYESDAGYGVDMYEIRSDKES